MLLSMEMVWTPRRQGDAGELSAINWLFSAGAEVYVPLFTNPDVDLIADFGECVDRVQVKTSTYEREHRWEVMLATRGGNRSWSGRVKVLDASRCDSLFIHVGDGRRWYIPKRVLGGCTHIVVGGPKYSDYEIESGGRLAARPPPVLKGP
jgi:hypothetical protein